MVGSLNLDLVVTVAEHPGPGDTVVGGDLRHHPGGKGANQAVAAARLGRRVAMVGCVGDDDAGRLLRRVLDDAGVDTAHLHTVSGTASGTALITVDHSGENRIVVSPGANLALGPDLVERAGPVIAAARAVLLQLEVPIDALATAARLATGLVMLNPAPAPAEPLPDALIDRVDVMVPNLGESQRLAATSARRSHARWVVTRGPAGALVMDADGDRAVAAPVVTPVDTTAAGDAFCAALVDGLLSGLDTDAAVTWACRVGAATTLQAGALPSLPTPTQVADRLERAR